MLEHFKLKRRSNAVLRHEFQSAKDHPASHTTPVLIDNEQFIVLISERAAKLLWIARLLAERSPQPISLSRPLIIDVLSQALQTEELLDAYGARNNRQWCRFRSLVAAIKLFANVTYELFHIHHCLPSYRLLPIERDFPGATARCLKITHKVLVRTSKWLLLHATDLGLAIPATTGWTENYTERLPIGRLPRDRSARRIKSAAETATHLATAYLNLAAKSELLNSVEKVQPKDYPTCFPDPISEESLRYLKVGFHCLQSLYDTYVSETEIEYLDDDLPTLRGHISVVFRLLEIATYLIHYYERHLNVHTGDSTLRRKPVIALKTLLSILMNYAIAFAGLYLTCGRCLCHTMLKHYAETGRIDVAVPSYRGFHVRPSTLVARIVRHYGSEVIMELDGQPYDAGTPMDIFRANEKINAHKRHWLVSEIARLPLPQTALSDNETRAAVLDIIVRLAQQSKLIVYQQPLQLSEEFNKDGILLETVVKEIARLQATGQLDIKTDLNIAFVGDKRVLKDLELLANSGYGEDYFGNNIALPKELAYLRR